MACRRMFALSVINRAQFLKMPISSQALYFHLGLHADDDGIVEAFAVLRTVGCSEDDLRVLDSKGFVKVLNEDLVTYIVDWNENNKLRSDRKKDSIYQNLLLENVPEAQLIESRERSDTKKKGDVVEFSPAECQTMDSQRTDNGQPTDNQMSDNGQSMDGQWTDNGRTMDSPWTDNGPHRIGKDSIGKDSLGKSSLGKGREGKNINAAARPIPSPYKEIFEQFNELCPSYPKALKLSPERRGALDRLINKYGFEDFKRVFEATEKSAYLKGFKNGKDHPGWRATFDFMIMEKHFVNALEGIYDDRCCRSPDDKLRDDQYAMLEKMEAEWNQE